MVCVPLEFSHECGWIDRVESFPNPKRTNGETALTVNRRRRPRHTVGPPDGRWLVLLLLVVLLLLLTAAAAAAAAVVLVCCRAAWEGRPAF